MGRPDVLLIAIVVDHQVIHGARDRVDRVRSDSSFEPPTFSLPENSDPLANQDVGRTTIIAELSLAHELPLTAELPLVAAEFALVAELSLRRVGIIPIREPCRSSE